MNFCFFRDGLAGLFRLLRFQTDTPVEVVYRLGGLGFPAPHFFHDFTSLTLCNVWFFFHCKNKLIKLLNVVLVYTSTDYRERSKVL